MCTYVSICQGLVPNDGLMEFTANHNCIQTVRRAAANLVNFCALLRSCALALLIRLTTTPRGTASWACRQTQYRASRSVLGCRAVALVVALQQGVASAIRFINDFRGTAAGCTSSPRDTAIDLRSRVASCWTGDEACLPVREPNCPQVITRRYQRQPVDPRQPFDPRPPVDPRPCQPAPPDVTQLVDQHPRSESARGALASKTAPSTFLTRAG